MSVVLAVTVAGVTLVLWWLASWWQQAPGSLVQASQGWAGPVQVALLTGGAVMLGGLLWVTFAAPSLLELSRKVERETGLAQRLSTAYEVVRAGGPGNAVTLALLADVESRSASLEVRGAASLPRQRAFGTTALFAVAAAVIALLIPVPHRNAASVAARSDGTPITAPTTAEAQTITELAHVLDLVADRSRNNYLQAVADSFAGLADRIEAGTITGREAQETVKELTQHLQAAAREVGGTFQQTIEGILAPTTSVLTMPAAMSNQLGEPLNVPPDGSGAVPAGTAAAVQPLPDVYMAFDKIVAEYEYDPSTLGLRPPGSVQSGGAADAGFYGGVMLAETDPNAATDDSPIAGRVAGQAGGDVAGAAQMSNDRAGDAAGAGEAGLGAGSDSFLGAEVEATSAAVLPSNESVDGAFSEVEQLPAPARSSTRLLDSTDYVGAFERSEESTFNNFGIGGSYVDVVARYFTPAERSRGDD